MNQYRKKKRKFYNPGFFDWTVIIGSSFFLGLFLVLTIAAFYIKEILL